MTSRRFRGAHFAALVLCLAAGGSISGAPRKLHEPRAARFLARPIHTPTLPPSSLAVERGGAWRAWWRSSRAPSQWMSALPVVERSLGWRAGRAGTEWGELRLAGSGEAWRTRVIVVQLDTARVRFRLTSALGHGMRRADWSIEQAPPRAVLAVNAGQFIGSLPWGWTVLRGREILSPGRGPLSTAVVVDTAGALHWVSALRIAQVRHARWVAAAFQSYPTLLEGDGVVPRALRTGAGGLDLAHRDARLAIGVTRDGHVLVALTRFDALGSALGFVPFGLTTPEMAAVMGALGCRAAVMLDGGISSQLLLRGGHGAVHRWSGIRRVPLGLLALPRRTK